MTARQPHTNPLVTYFGSLDSRMLGYVDARGQLRADTAVHVHRYVVALIEGAASPGWVTANWSDFYDLVTGFVLAYGTPMLAGLYGGAPFLDWLGHGADVALGAADLAFLVVLADHVHRYSEAAGGT